VALLIVVAWVGALAEDATLSLAPTADQETKIQLIMVNERASLSQSLAFKDFHRFTKMLAYHNGWAPRSVRGKFFKNIRAANIYVKEHKPRYAFLTLPVFLAWKKRFNLGAIGYANTQGNSQWMAASSKYHIISSSETSLADCKSKRVISHFWKDAQFLNAAVGGSAWSVKDFDEFPLSASDSVLSSLVSEPPKADCALVDDAQMGDMKRLAGADKLKTLWSSAQLPAVIVAYFPSVSWNDQMSFKNTLPDICAGNGLLPCAAMGITSFQVAEPADLQSLESMSKKYQVPVSFKDGAVATQASDQEDETSEESEVTKPAT